MKKVILSSVLAAAAAVSMNAGAATVCAAGAAGASSVTLTTDTTTFVKVAFNPKCSANVHLSYGDNNTYFTVGSGSSKGKTSWMGSTAGGSVSKHADCPSTGCTATEANAAYAAAPSS